MKEARNAAGENLDMLSTLDNALAERDTLARLSAEAYAGKIHPRIVACLTSLMTLQLHAIETTDLEQRPQSARL